MQQVRITIPFFLWFFKYRKPLKRIATLTSRQAIENSPHNKKLLLKHTLLGVGVGLGLWLHSNGLS